MHFKQQIKSVAFALAALTAVGANAAIVTQWTVGVDAAFLPGSIVDSNGGTPGGVVISNANKTLRWGTDIGNGQSGLDITNSPVNTVVNTGVNTVLPPVGNVFVTHTNQPIQSPSLDKVTLAITLQLTPLTPPLGILSPDPLLTFLIDFQETPNGDDPCANGGANNSGVNINGCGDIFVIGNDALNFSFFYDTDGAGVDDPQEYFVSFVEVTGGLNALSPAACFAATGSNAPCLGFVTPEKAVTSFQFGSLITTEKVEIIPDPPKVPEPGILALMGLGLAGLGGMRRRRKA